MAGPETLLTELGINHILYWEPMPTQLATRTTGVSLFYHFCVLVSDTVQLVPVFVNDDKSVVDFGFLHLFSAFSDLIFPHFALLLTTFTFQLPL